MKLALVAASLALAVVTPASAHGWGGHGGGFGFFPFFPPVFIAPPPVYYYPPPVYVPPPPAPYFPPPAHLPPVHKDAPAAPPAEYVQ